MPDLSRELPPPRFEGSMPLEQAIRLRRSVRSFKNKPVDYGALGQILWAAQGLRGEGYYRTAPSAGALYPLELFTVSQSEIAHYLPESHTLQQLKQGDFRPALAQAALDQTFILQAPITLIIGAVPSRTSQKYGIDRSARYIAIEVGHAAQNAMLQAAALDLGSVAVGAFDDDEIAELLDLSDTTVPLYLVPIGYPA